MPFPCSQELRCRRLRALATGWKKPEPKPRARLDATKRIGAVATYNPAKLRAVKTMPTAIGSLLPTRSETGPERSEPRAVAPATATKSRESPPTLSSPVCVV